MTGTVSGAKGARILFVALAASLALAGCGRKAPLDRPGISAEQPPAPSQSAITEQEDALSSVFGDRSGGGDEPPAKPQRRFFLDPLLD